LFVIQMTFYIFFTIFVEILTAPDKRRAARAREYFSIRYMR